jgi:hypothetical protein
MKRGAREGAKMGLAYSLDTCLLSVTLATICVIWTDCLAALALVRGGVAVRW